MVGQLLPKTSEMLQYRYSEFWHSKFRNKHSHSGNGRGLLVVLLLHACAWWVDILPLSLSLSTDVLECVLFYQLAGRGQPVYNASPPHQLTRGVPVNAYEAYYLCWVSSLFFGHNSCMRCWSCLFKAEWGCCCILPPFPSTCARSKRHEHGYN
jgi:hypothetical protein